MVIVKSVESILSIIIMVSIGFCLNRKHWFSPDTSKVFTKLVTNISLPLLMIYSLMNNFDRKKLIGMSKGLIIPFLSIAICCLIAIAVSRFLCTERINQGLFTSMFFNSNTIFVGLPVNLALFGHKSLPYVLLYYIANTTFFWTIGVYYVRKSSRIQDAAASSKIEVARRLFSPPLMGFIIAIIFILFGIKLPAFIMDTCNYMGNLTTPLSMLFIGITISNVNLKTAYPCKDAAGVALGRFIVSPLIVILLTHFFAISPLMKSVFIIQASMPVMTQTSIVAKSYGADAQYAAVITVITTISSIITIPLFMFLIT